MAGMGRDERGEWALGFRRKFWFGFGGWDVQPDFVCVAEPDKGIPDTVVGFTFGGCGGAWIVAAHRREKG